MFVSIVTPEEHAEAHRVFYEETYGARVRATKGKAQKRAFTQDLRDWYDANREAFVEQQFRDGKANKWMKTCIESFQGLVSVLCVCVIVACVLTLGSWRFVGVAHPSQLRLPSVRGDSLWGWSRWQGIRDVMGGFRHIHRCSRGRAVQPRVHHGKYRPRLRVGALSVDRDSH